MQGNKAYWLKIDSYNQAGEAIAFPLTWRVKASTEINDQADASSQIFATHLSQGWNHGKLPLDKTLTNPADIERFIAGTAIERIWYYQQSQDRWFSWIKGETLNQSLTELNPEAIYWVYSSREHIVAKASGINSQKYYLHNNHLGSVSFESDANGQITESSLYQPYGASLANNTQSSKKVSPYSFSGKEQDGSGLYYFEARYYDPVTTRFISPDPFYASEQTKCVDRIVECNLYQYAGNNPVMIVDPTGLAGLTFMLSGTANAGAGVGAASNVGTWFSIGMDSEGITLAAGTFESAEGGAHAGASAGAGGELTIMLSEDFTQTTEGMFMAAGGSGGEGIVVGGDLVMTLPANGDNPVYGGSINIGGGGGAPVEAHVRTGAGFSQKLAGGKLNFESVGTFFGEVAENLGKLTESFFQELDQTLSSSQSGVVDE